MTQRIVVKLRLSKQARELRVFGREYTEAYSYDDQWRINRKQLENEAAAKAHLETTLAARLKNKFEVLGRTDDEVPPRAHPHVDAHDATLEAACLRDRSSRSPWQVYADWLQSQGDARGEIAALFQTGKAKEAGALISGRDRDALFGPVSAALDLEILGGQFEHGFLSAVSLRRNDMESKTQLDVLTRQVLALPVARFVHSLQFGLASFESDNDWSASMHAVTDWPHANQIRSLQFNDYTSEDCELSWTAFGDFSEAWAKLPNLEVLEIRAGQEGNTLGLVDLPQLKRFVRESGGLSRAELTEIVKAKWPQLEHLELWLGSSEYGAQGTTDDLTPILEGTGLPKLTHLGVVNSEIVVALISALSTSKILKQLKSLDLSKSVLSDSNVDAFIALKSHFAHVASIDVTDNALSDAALARLQVALPNVVSHRQREEEESRYVAVGE